MARKKTTTSRVPRRVGMTAAATLLAAAASPARAAASDQPGRVNVLAHRCVTPGNRTVGEYAHPAYEHNRSTTGMGHAGSVSQSQGHDFAFQYDGVLGTSLDMLVRGCPAPEAHTAVRAVLREIDRLSAILNTRHPASEISRIFAGQAQSQFNAQRLRSHLPVLRERVRVTVFPASNGRPSPQPSPGGPGDGVGMPNVVTHHDGRCSPEIVELLEHYRDWSDRTGGVISCHLQPLIDVWRRAEAGDASPSEEAIAAALVATRQPASSCDADGERSFTPSGGINFDALGKAYIVDRALSAAARATRGASGIMLNVGGDIRVWGEARTIGIADPFSPADNAPPLALVNLKDQAIATSAGYARSFTIGGRRLSHILDLRSGRPANAAASSTAIAADALTANALSLTLCVIGPREGASLVARHGASALVIENDGTVHRLGNFAHYEEVGWAYSPSGPRPAPSGAVGECVHPTLMTPNDAHTLGDPPAGAWQADHQVSIALTLKPHPGRRAHRPYVAVWIEDANHKPLRTIAVWGNDAKYQRDLTRWSKIAPQDPKIVAAVTRATRQPGKYTLVWDGRDDAGKPVPAGKYTVFVEINREHGTHTTTSATVACGGAAAASATGDATEEAEAIDVAYAWKEAR